MYQHSIKLFILFSLLLAFAQTQCPCTCSGCLSRPSCTECGNAFSYDSSSGGCLRCDDCKLQHCCSCHNNDTCNLCKWGFKRQLYNGNLYRCTFNQNPCQQWGGSNETKINYWLIATIVALFLLIFAVIMPYLIYRYRTKNHSQLVEEMPMVQPLNKNIPIDLNWYPYTKTATWQVQICAICLDSSVQIETSRQHFFHFLCLRNWCQKKKSCSTCKKEIQEFKIICRLCKTNCADVTIGQLNRPIPNTCDSCRAPRNP